MTVSRGRQTQLRRLSPQESPETPSSAKTVQGSAQTVQGSAQVVQESAQAARESAPAAQAAASAARILTFPLPEEHMEAQKLWNFFQPHISEDPGV